jgi:hypothetical protein
MIILIIDRLLQLRWEITTAQCNIHTYILKKRDVHLCFAHISLIHQCELTTDFTHSRVNDWFKLWVGQGYIRLSSQPNLFRYIVLARSSTFGDLERKNKHEVIVR